MVATLEESGNHDMYDSTCRFPNRECRFVRGRGQLADGRASSLLLQTVCFVGCLMFDPTISNLDD